MFTFIIDQIRSFTQRRKRFDKAGAYANLLYAEYWTYGSNRHEFRQLTREYALTAFPLIRQKIETEINADAHKNMWASHRYCWFELWLIWKTGRQMRLKTKHYHHANIFLLCAESELLRRKSWEEISRNLPACAWLRLTDFSASVLIHLAVGYNVRRHPTFAHFTRKMAHQFHVDTGENMVANVSGVPLFLQTIGRNFSDHDWLIYGILQTLVGYPAKKDTFIHLRPLAERLFELFSDPRFNKGSWSIVREYIVDNWSGRSKQVLKNFRDPERLEKAANRYFDQRIEQIDLAKLLKEFDYEPNTRWQARNRTHWNLRTQYGWYRMVELQTAEDIVHEGAVMHHCVGDYLEECLNGDERVCSLRFRANGKTKWRSVVTVSVAANGYVSEAKGIMNAELNEHYQRLVEAWAVGEQVKVDWTAIID